jgi:hypothetical protein
MHTALLLDLVFVLGPGRARAFNPGRTSAFPCGDAQARAGPLDKSLYEEKKWAKQWLEDIPDINVTICAPLMFGVDFISEQNKYTSQLSYQATFGSAAYIIEHPDKAGDLDAQFLAGVESALKAYSAIVKSEPQAKSKALDDLLEKRKQGKLADFVRSASKSCQNKKEGV